MAKVLARAAHCDVTPRDRRVPLAGYAARVAPVSDVIDPIEISALLLEAGGRRSLLLSFDLMLIGSELQSLVQSKLAMRGFDLGETVLLASHTHSAPATDQACRRLGEPDAGFVAFAAEAIDGLVARLLREEPSEVRLELFRGRLDHSINRRLHWPFPTIGRMHGFRANGITISPNPSGPKNEIATAIVLRKEQGSEPLAVLWHYTCHPTAMPLTDTISADYPGVARRLLRQQFGDVACVFAQGFCGNVRPHIVPSGKIALRERIRRAIRVISSGPLFPVPSFKDWQAWSESLSAELLRIAGGAPIKVCSGGSVRTSTASVPLNHFFHGSTPEKPLTVHIVRIGEEVEIVALSAEASVEWQEILDAALPTEGRIRLYAGYSGALFGYLPTGQQVTEGGYEVDGFQRLFGLSGQFDSNRVEPAVVACVRQAFENLEHEEHGAYQAVDGRERFEI